MGRTGILVSWWEIGRVTGGRILWESRSGIRRVRAWRFMLWLAEMEKEMKIRCLERAYVSFLSWESLLLGRSQARAYQPVELFPPQPSSLPRPASHPRSAGAYYLE